MRNEPGHIAGISKTAYALATPRWLHWRHVHRRTRADDDASSADPDPSPESDGITVYGCEPDEADLFHELCTALRDRAHDHERRRVGEPASSRCPATDASAWDTSPRSPAPICSRARKAPAWSTSPREASASITSTCERRREPGITVENVAYTPDGVADFTLMLILMAIRNVKKSSALRETSRLQAGQCPRQGPARPDRRRPRGRAHRHSGDQRLQGFGCRVLACSNDRRRRQRRTSSRSTSCCGESDVVTLHLPLTADTHHLIGREQHRDDEAGRVPRQHRTRRAGRHRRAARRRWRAGSWAARRWTCWKARKGSSTSTAATRPVDHPAAAAAATAAQRDRSRRTPPTTPARAARHRREDPHQLPALRNGTGRMRQARRSRSCSGAARRSMTSR